MAGQYSYSQSYSGGATPSQSQSNSFNSGFPELLQSPQSYYSQIMAELDQELGQNTYNWAQNEFNNTNQLSNAAINNLNAQSATALSRASGYANQYATLGAPSLQALYNMAGQYNSQARQAVNQGQAESTAEQAGNQAWMNTVQQLQQSGIDPSSGMYGELEQANKAETAASAAGAAQQARVATTATGQQLLGETVNASQQLPGMTANEANIGAGTAEAGANINLAQGNLGAKLMDTAQPYLSSAASALKLPGQGSVTRGGSTSTSTGGTPNSSESSSASAPGNSGGGGGGGGVSTGGNYGGGVYDISGGGTPSGGDSISFGGGDSGGSGGGGGGYAAGGDVGEGVIPDDATSGGFVPREASPSQGAVTDDIPARLNAEEFVIPRDVNRWKGEEFFQKLIAQSRKARMQAAAQASPTPGPPLGGQQPQFISHNLGGPI